VDRPRAADDFATIRARMEELRSEHDGADPEGKKLPLAPAARRGHCDPVLIFSQPAEKARTPAALVNAGTGRCRVLWPGGVKDSVQSSADGHQGLR
jgi:hypothetical protein